MRKTFADTMLEVGQVDPRLVVLVGDISHGILQPYAIACPGRYYNVGILEPTIVSMSAGLAHSGLFPVAHTIAPFIIERSVEQIKLDFCYQNIGGTLVSVGSAFDYSGLGCSHHCYCDLGLIKAIPNTEVIYPAMPNEFNILFKDTYRDGKLTYFRLPGKKHGIDIPDKEIRLGKGILLRRGKDATILATGPQLNTAIQAATALAEIGIGIDLLYYHTIKPFDESLLMESLNKTKNILVVEEHSKYNGIGEDVLRTTCNVKGASYSFINIPDKFLRGYGTYTEHCSSLGFTIENIVRVVQELIYKNGKG